MFPTWVTNSYNLQHNGDYGNIELPNQDNSHIKLISNTTVQLNQNWLEIDLEVLNFCYHNFNQNQPVSFTFMNTVGKIILF